MLSFCTFIGTQAALICRNVATKAGTKKNPILPVVAIMASVIIGIALTLIFPAADEQASFLEEYDFSGKTIIPFCSHGGGRFGHSLTATAKRAPDAVMGEGLSVHYSGGSALSDDVTIWFEANGIKRD